MESISRKSNSKTPERTQQVSVTIGTDEVRHEKKDLGLGWASKRLAKAAET